MNKQTLKDLQQELSCHPVYLALDNPKALRIFMESHVFAVWDFMSLLKSLQRKLTCVEVPWKPALYGDEVTRLINQIVLGEESDVDYQGRACSHFNLYLSAMEEVGADTSLIKSFVREFDFNFLPQTAQKFVTMNIDLSLHGNIEEVAAAFFYGREKLVPEMFKTIVSTLEKEKLDCPALIYYLKRHIEVDEGEHGPLAYKCLETLIGEDPLKRERATKAAYQALKMRKELWDNVLREIQIKNRAHGTIHH